MNNFIEFIIKIIDDTGKGIIGYIKSQIILMIITFISFSVGLYIIGAPLPILIGLGIAILDIVPVLGSGLVMIPWSLINFISGNTDMGTKLAILYVALTIFRQVIEPKITGDQIGLRPLYTFAATVLGSLILGPIGVIGGPIIAIIINSIYKAKKEGK
ncbi:AI-2E family transporter [Tissierellaceae bacterium HCP3S3_D8]